MTALQHFIRDFRPDVEDERHFVVKGWASEMRQSNFGKHVPNALYWPSQHELAERCMSAGQTLIACDPEDEDTLYGCLVHVPGPLAIVHWLFVKGHVRRMRIASALLDAAIGDRTPLYFTQPSRFFDKRDVVERLGWIATPYLLMGIAPAPLAKAA